MSRTKKLFFLVLGIASALGIAWLAQQRRDAIRGMRTWRQVLTKYYGPGKTQRLENAIRRQYAHLTSRTEWPPNQALRWHLKENLLPGLALYHVLLEEHQGNQAAALAEVDEAFRAWTLAKSRALLAPLKVFPAPFKFFRLALAQTMKRFPSDGWDFEYVENSDNRVAFNGTRCFYLETLTAYGAPELTASFCKTDDVMAECFPPAIRFIRLHTLGRGDAVCDFQYQRVEPGSQRARK